MGHLPRQPDSSVSDPRQATRCQGDGGAAVVEMALVAPLLAMLLFGIYEVSRGYNAKVELTSGVREGARAAALGRTNAAARQAVVDASPGLRPDPTVTIVRACPATPAATDNAVVRATYAMPYSIPFVSSATWNITAEGVMRCGL